MKNSLVITLTIIGAACAAACIGLIAVIILNSNTRSNHGSSDTTIPIPERFREIADTTTPAANDSIEKPPTPDRPSAPHYAGSITGGTMVSPATLNALLEQRNLFCKKSQWSKLWANPAGKGIRLKGAGLAFADSVVTDSLTHRMWQRYSTYPEVKYGDIDAAIGRLNTSVWQGYRNWRAPTIEELMVLLTPTRNHYGLHLPDPWDCQEVDFWSSNPAADSVSVQWMWVVRMGAGRCNYGHPDMARSLLAVREYY